MVEKSKFLAVRDEITKAKTGLQENLDGAMPTDKFIRIVHTTLRLNPSIAEASTKSILGACMKAAADGLALDGREAALIVYRGKDGPEARYQPMVAGIHKKVRQSGEISVFNSFLVYENDDFSITYGMAPSVNHTPHLKGARGDIIGCYAVCKFKTGDSDLEWMTIDEIEAIRARSKAKNAGPWVTDWGEMARKTVIRRMSKRLPMGDAASMVERIDELYDLGKDDDYVGPARKKRGQGAAALNDPPEDDAVIDVDPETGEILDGKPAADPGSKPDPEPKETPAQKTAREAKKKADDALAEAEAAATAAEEDDGEPDSEDLI